MTPNPTTGGTLLRDAPQTLKTGLAEEMAEIGRQARSAAAALALAAPEAKTRALQAAAAAVRANEAEILAANARDLAEADGEGLAPVLRDRLALELEAYRSDCCRARSDRRATRPGRPLARPLGAAQRTRHRAQSRCRSALSGSSTRAGQT